MKPQTALSCLSNQLPNLTWVPESIIRATWLLKAGNAGQNDRNGLFFIMTLQWCKITNFWSSIL